MTAVLLKFYFPPPFLHPFLFWLHFPGRLLKHPYFLHLWQSLQEGFRICGGMFNRFYRWKPQLELLLSCPCRLFFKFTLFCQHILSFPLLFIFIPACGLGFVALLVSPPLLSSQLQQSFIAPLSFLPQLSSQPPLSFLPILSSKPPWGQASQPRQSSQQFSKSRPVFKPQQ